MTPPGAWSPPCGPAGFVAKLAEHSGGLRKLWDRSEHDIYGAPGAPLRHLLPSNRVAVQSDGTAIWLIGDGSSQPATVHSSTASTSPRSAPSGCSAPIGTASSASITCTRPASAAS